ncbi:MAG: alpha/beta hydrolase, partial [Pseudonocardia sp.]|nr:alpha/beta hydrolase [Pseudonocardia sp.]
AVPELADLVHELLVATTGPAVVVANSFGCVVAVELALRRPELVRRLVLTSPAGAPGIRSLGPVALRFLAAMRHEPTRYLGVVVHDIGRGWTRKRRANLRALLSYPIEEKARGLTVPALVVRGREDRLVPAEFARRLAATIPQGSRVELAAAHALPFSAPAAIARLVLDDDHPEGGA